VSAHAAQMAALRAGDARALAAALLRDGHRPSRSPVAALEAAASAASELTARSLRGPEDLAAARTYAAAWDLLHDREMRAWARRQRDRAALAATSGRP